MLIYYCRKEDHDAVRLTILFPMHCGHVLPECGPVVQGRRHKFESGGYYLRAKRAKKIFFVPPTFCIVGGTVGGYTWKLNMKSRITVLASDLRTQCT